MSVMWKIKEKALAWFEDTENQRKENSIYLPSYLVEISLIMSLGKKCIAGIRDWYFLK